MTYPVKSPKKLIEVALPLDAINVAAAREKSIRHGHPSTLHLWWARRPLAAARAVIFSQLVNDPSWKWDMENPGQIPPGHLKASWAASRKRLFKIIEDLVLWENTTNEEVLERARTEIRKSWREVCELNKEHPQAAELFNPDKLPALHDPFAGGGSIPLEAQRLGLEAYASDLNPVAVLINKAMIEIPPKFAGQPPVNPEARKPENALGKAWKGAAGLADDVRYYGAWMRAEAQKRIGHLYPPVEITAEMARERPDLKPLVGQKLTVIAWLWARTVKSPNPAFSHVDVPLVSTFILSNKAGKESYVQPVVEGDYYHFTVKLGTPPPEATNGTKLARGASFRCLLSNVAIEPSYIKAEGLAQRMGARLMAVVAEGIRGRIYLAPSAEMEAVAMKAKPTWKPELSLPDDPRNFWTLNYGLTSYGDLFTPRQLVALTTFSDLVSEAREKIRYDAFAVGMDDDGKSVESGGVSTTAYAEAVSVYLAFAISRTADRGSSICSWDNSPKMEALRNTFGRQAIPMVWDFAEGNPFSDSSGNWLNNVEWGAKVVDKLPAIAGGIAAQVDAQNQSVSGGKLISTDPPYCLAPGTLIQTETGYLPIERVQIGDRVLTHTGRFARVIRTYHRPHRGVLYRIKVAHSSQPLLITGEHPIYGIHTGSCAVGYAGYCHVHCAWMAQNHDHCSARLADNYSLEWIPARKVRVNDLIFLPTFQGGNAPASFDLTDWLPEEDYLEHEGVLYYQKATERSLIRRKTLAATSRRYAALAQVALTPDLCRLLGYFVADGYARVEPDGGTIQFVFHIEEQELGTDVERLMTFCFGLQPGRSTDNRHWNNQSMRLNFYSKPVAQLLRNWCYTEGGLKRLPSWSMGLDPIHARELLHGYWAGDGYRANGNYIASTNSPHLAGQIRLLLQRMRIVSRLHVRQVKPTEINGKAVIARSPHYGIYVSGSSLLHLAEIVGAPKDKVLSGRRNGQHGAWWEGGYLLPIRAVESLEYDGIVYNLETEEHSYVTAAGCVHNCDNIGYADLSDFFYVWLRRALKPIFPDLFTTLAVPKAEELVSTPYRHGGNKRVAERFFMEGMTQTMYRLAEQSHRTFPVTIYYAYKQQETEGGEGTSSTGWQGFLESVIRAGFAITGTWPIRTELGNRMVAMNSNSLASSIALVCRKRPTDAPTTSRREFLRQLNAVLPEALDEMTKGAGGDRSPVAPVDLSQAIIGPGMAVFSKYTAVLEADGAPMSVRTALQLINRFLAEDDFDHDTQFCLHWFDQYGWKEGRFGEADVLARAKATSVSGLAEGGVVRSGGGAVRLLRPDEYPHSWDPQHDTRSSIWEILHHLIRTLKHEGETGAGRLLAAVRGKGEATRQLAYRLYTLCERQGWAEDARAYNELITTWTGIESAAMGTTQTVQRSLFD